MENKFKPQEITIQEKPIVFDTQSMFNQSYIDDLTKLLVLHTTTPTSIPTKMIDCIYLYWDKSTTYRLYIYINNIWKYTTLS